MHAIIRRHLPVITSRIDFSVCPQPPLPVITQRTSFLDYNGLHDVSSDMGDDVGDDKGDDEGDGLGDDVAGGLGDDVASMGDGLDDGLDDGLGDTVMNEIASASNINAGIGDYFIPGTSVIPKPPGEPGRPQSGGFNVEATLAWPKSTFTKVVNYTHLQASKVLDTSKCYSKQSKVKIDSVCVSTALHHPIVSKYEDLWPVRSILKLHLKSTSEIARRAKTKATAKKIKKAIRKPSVESEDE